MTLPYERTRAVNATRNFLNDLLSSKKTPRVPKEIRLRASACLRHYPNEYDMEVISSLNTDVNNPFVDKVFGKAFE